LQALAILAAARPSDTPVIHARNLGRDGEAVELCRLDGFDPSTVDMLSLVIVGACQTRLVERQGRKAFVYTPRGYLAGDTA
jgi:cobalt-precorrin 5A hydrolase / precorrin-3B C17-methyltransferase